MLIVAVLGIAFVLLSVSSMLISTYLSKINLPSTPFREAVTQIYFGSRGTMATALADVTKRLNQQAKSTLYQDHTELDDPNVKNSGFQMVSDWQNDTMRYYPATGLSLNFSGTDFYCDWNEPSRRTGYSKAVSNVSIGLLNYGFNGTRDEIDVEFNATVQELIENDGSEISFKIDFVREKGYPLDDMVKGLITVLFEIHDLTEDYRSLNETKVESVEHLYEGLYIITINNLLNNITYNLDRLEESVSTEVTDNATKACLLGNLTEIQMKYAANNVKGSHNQLLTQFRPTLVSWQSNSSLVRQTDTILSQMIPYVRVVALDFRGITVSAYGNLTKPEDDVWGPDIYGAQAQPSHPAIGQDVTLQAIADDRYNGNSNITQVEYFISPTQPTQNGTGNPMLPSDGAFDEPLEQTTVTVLSSYLSPGVNKLWIHARDSKGIWGAFETIIVTVSQSGTLSIFEPVTMQGMYYYYWSWRYNYIRATVKIVDGYGAPVEGASVHVFWIRNGQQVKSETKMAGSGGTCTFDSPEWRGGRRTYTITVDSVSKAGYTWDGHIVSATLSYP
jgi:hypothetical protein